MRHERIPLMAIIFENICLAKLELEVYPENAKTLKFNIALDSKSEFPEADHLIQTTEFDITHNQDDAPFTFKFTFISFFKSEGEGQPTLKEFAEVNATAYVIPYARELISNITSRLGIVPTLVLPPINVFKLVQDAKKRQEEKPET
jgi:preprotein translocase subunit SecB